MWAYACPVSFTPGVLKGTSMIMASLFELNKWACNKIERCTGEKVCNLLAATESDHEFLSRVIAGNEALGISDEVGKLAADHQFVR